MRPDRPPSFDWRGAVAIAFVCISTFVLLSSGVVAAQEEAPTDESESTEATQTDLVVTNVERNEETGEVTAEVVVPVALIGEPLPDGSITVIVGNRRQDVTYTPISGDDLEVILVVDVSGSMAGEPLAAAKAASASFINLLPEGVDVAVVAFDQTAVVSSALSESREESLRALDELAVGGDTALFDAVILASGEFSEDRATRRVIIALTDGGDSASVASLEDARDALRAAEIEPYAVALATSESAAENLEELIAGTEGRLERTDSTDALLPLYDDLAAQLANRFTIRFTPEDHIAGEALMLVNANGVLAGSDLTFEASAAPVREAASSATPTVVRQVTPVIPQAPEEHTGVLSSWSTTTTAKLIGLVSIAATLFVVGLLISFPSQQMSLITDRGRNAASNAQVSDVTARLEGAAVRILNRHGRERRLARSLEKAGVALRPAEFVVLAGALALAAALLAGLLLGFWIGVIVLPLSFFVARAHVARLARIRSKKFAEQLPATLQLMAGGLRAGYALSQAVEHVATEANSPTSDEFHRLSTEVRLGRDFSESMHAMSDRLGVEDFTWVVHAIDIHREVGGDLAEILDKVHATMRDRNFVVRQVSALSAEGRYSAYMITSLPFLVAIILRLTNPEYIGRLFEGPRGYFVLLVAATLIAIGTTWMRALVKVKF
jgi:tight adherence protein B